MEVSGLAMPRVIDLFPEVAIKLQEEIFLNHPSLSKDLARMSGATVEEKVGMIALYCGFGTDGWFREKDLEILFEMLLKKLKEKSTIVVR